MHLKTTSLTGLYNAEKFKTKTSSNKITLWLLDVSIPGTLSAKQCKIKICPKMTGPMILQCFKNKVI